MLCPEVWNFPPPKVVSSYKKFQSFGRVESIITLNNFYRSVILTCPDELQMPKLIEEAITDDSEYYRISDCSLTEFLEPIFIESFVKRGKLFCLSADKNCVIQNCASVTPDGILTLHVLEFIHQTLGLDGTKVPHGYKETKVDLKLRPITNKIKNAVEKLEKFDFYVSWEPDTEDICPSSIAKYFSDRNIPVSSHSLEIKRLSPDITEVPSLIDAEIEDIVEWIGMLANDGDLKPTEAYVSTYKEPECSSCIKTNRISLLVAKGFLTPLHLCRILQCMSDYVTSREIENYWACMSVQSIEDSLWRWNTSSPYVFQSHNSSCNIFFTSKDLGVYSIGQLKYS